MPSVDVLFHFEDTKKDRLRETSDPRRWNLYMGVHRFTILILSLIVIGNNQSFF